MTGLLIAAVVLLTALLIMLGTAVLILASIHSILQYLQEEYGYYNYDRDNEGGTANA